MIAMAVADNDAFVLSRGTSADRSSKTAEKNPPSTLRNQLGTI